MHARLVERGAKTTMAILCIAMAAVGAQGHAGVAFSIAMHILLKSAHVSAIMESPGTAENFCHAALEVIEQ